MGKLVESELSALVELIKPGDLLVLNDAATLPASLFGMTERGEVLELRLVSEIREGEWRGIIFGKGNWREKTEDRAPAPFLSEGGAIQFGDSLKAKVIGISKISPHLVQVQFNLLGKDFIRELYAQGSPVQYSYLKGTLPLWEVQSPFASRPWTMEMPSAGAALPLSLLMEIRRKGIRVASLTHACGLSSSGDPVIDRILPLPERYEVPQKTVEFVHEAQKRKGRIIAAGTSVMRALEGNALGHGGVLTPGKGETGLLIGPGFQPKVVDGLLTGLHEVEESHYRLALSLLSESSLLQILEMAKEKGLKSHEFGDLCLIL
jgi:S-adenosylmethionine:tRNA ribosyltransferase-isomerase